MKDVIDVGSNSVSKARSEDGRFYIETTFYDDAALQRNSEIRKAGFTEKMTLGLHDNADVRGSFSVPSVEQWNLYRKNNPEVYALLHSKLEHERMRGLKKIYTCHPEWFLNQRF